LQLCGLQRFFILLLGDKAGNFASRALWQLQNAWNQMRGSGSKKPCLENGHYDLNTRCAR
jgi:hypothetical protein